MSGMAIEPSGKAVVSAMHAEFRLGVEKIAAEVSELAAREFEKRIRREVALCAMRVTDFYEVRRAENRIVIEVRLGDKP